MLHIIHKMYDHSLNRSSIPGLDVGECLDGARYSVNSPRDVHQYPTGRYYFSFVTELGPRSSHDIFSGRAVFFFVCLFIPLLIHFLHRNFTACLSDILLAASHCLLRHREDFYLYGALDRVISSNSKHSDYLFLSVHH
ncbi:hypothetical protein BDQ12DRAFT_85325 [Crucibulum laeve]|uniref:Uncharacterized protein n=1 Tax=Crucibulum laeve TaxID=68775 RepID=A0A5C3M3J0_9AGAR|nr:hypothetical protein BDQ12DRAFT_85325 [Crucibulum laeve]